MPDLPPDDALQDTIDYVAITRLQNAYADAVTRRAWAKFQSPGVYATTVTQPGFFRRYLLEQLQPLVGEYGATIRVGVSDREMPYPYVLDRGD